MAALEYSQPEAAGLLSAPERTSHFLVNPILPNGPLGVSVNVVDGHDFGQANGGSERT
jgi:hypothetical protein